MTNNKSTKRALSASIISMTLCIVLLIGTTFAWFTDSVSSGTNVIKAGNLDVKLEYSKDGTNWTNADGATDLFDSSAKWEPGHVEVVYLKVSNAGDLALKYKLGVNVLNTVIEVWNRRTEYCVCRSPDSFGSSHRQRGFCITGLYL